jgi:hypothetical protein
LLNSNYIVLDAARMGMNIETAKQLNPEFKCLFQGKTELELAGVAPFLFSYSSNFEFKQWFEKLSIGNSWGVSFHSHLPFIEIYKHCRRFLIVKNAGDQEIYFRFYDARVLRIFLPTCSRSQLNDFFGPINSFIVEDENPDFILKFTFDNIRLLSNRFARIDFQNHHVNKDTLDQESTITSINLDDSPTQIVSINKAIFDDHSTIDSSKKTPSVSDSNNKWNKFFFD